MERKVADWITLVRWVAGRRVHLHAAQRREVARRREGERRSRGPPPPRRAAAHVHAADAYGRWLWELQEELCGGLRQHGAASLPPRGEQRAALAHLVSIEG